MLLKWILEVTLQALSDGSHLPSFQGSQKLSSALKLQNLSLGSHVFGEGFKNLIPLQFFILEF